MAIPTITKMQKTAQQMLDTYKKQQTASTAATQSGSTSTPTVSSTPKVTQTQKAQPSVTQPTVTSQIVSNPTQPVDLTKINLFKPQETVKTIQQAAPNLLSKKTEAKDVQAGPIPGSVINAANAVGGETQTQVKKTVLQQFKDWFKNTDEKMQKSSEQFREKAWEDYYVGDFWKNLIRGETQAEEYVARLTDKLAGKGNEGYVEAFEKGQGEFWRQEIDSYNKYVEAAKAGDISSQEFGKKVGEFVNKLSGGKWSGEGWAEFASSTASTLKDPRQFVGNLGNMLPWLVLSQAGGLGLGMAYGTAQQSEDVYEDFSTDEGITNNLNDNQIFLLSSGVGTVLSLVEGLGDILGDLPWAKTFSKNIRGTIGKILKKDISKTLVKDIEDSLERDIKKEFKNPIKNAIIKWFKGGLGEFAEEPIQNEIQNEVAIGAGSNRQRYTLAQLATMGIVSFVYGSALQTIGLPVNIKQNQDLKNSYEERSKEADKVAPGLKDEVKENMFASLVAAQIRDTQLSDKKLNEYQKQAENLYNQKAELESQLENTTDPRVKQTINNQIKDIDAKINDIDQKVNQRQNTVEEVNKQIEEFKEKQELPVQQPSITKQEGGRNLSQQTMQTVAQPEVEEISRQESPAPSESQQLYEYTEAKKIGTKNRVSVKDVNKILKLTGEKQRKEMSKYSLNALGGILNYVRQMMPDKYESIRANAESVLKDLADAKEKIRLFEEQYGKRYEPEKMLRQSEAEGKKGTKFVTNNMKADLEHLVGLKGVTIKDTDKKIDKKIADYLSLTLSEVMTGLGIDFNKVLKKYGLEFQLTTSTRTRIPGEGIDTRGIFVRSRSRLTGDIIRIGMGLLLNGRTEQEIKSTLRHELIHMLDGTSLTKGGAFEKYPNYRDFYTFKGHEKNSSYWNDPSEVIARYGQQYLADIFDKQEFEHLCNEDYFWSKEEFEKLKGLFEDFIGQFSDLELDDANKNYYGVMIMLNDYKQGKLSSDEKRLESIRDRYELGETEMSRDIEQKILSMEKEYAWITEQVESLEGDIKDEIKLGYEITLQEISTNLDMLATMKEKYIEATKNTKAQQENLNEITNTISDNIDNAETSAADVEQGSEVISDTVTEPESEDNPTGVDTNAPLHEQVKQSVDITLQSVDKLVKNKKNKAIIHEVGQGFKNAFTPALSRLYSISPRLAGGVHRYQAMKELLTNSYKKATLDFVKAMDKLKKKNPEVYKKLSLALFDYGMVDTIEIKEELKKAGIDPKLFEPVAQVLNQIAKDYQAAGLDITVNDKYFPRKVKDYGLLLDYLSMKSGKNIEDTRTTLLKFIEDTNNDPTLSEGEKEKKIHSRLINEFSKPSEMSNNAKERKLVLSEWQLTEEEKAKGYKNDITDFYEEPIVALSMYIEDMVKKTELKKMLGGLTEQGTAISEDFDTSVAGILMEMQAKGELTKEQADEAAYVIKSIVNVKPSGKLVQAIKDATYNLTIANYLSAAQQLEDLAKTLLRGPSGFKNIVKSILGKAGIKMKDTGLNNLFDTVQKGGLTDWNFKLSGFDMVDSLGKVSFLNTAYDSCVKQANGRRAIILQHRLTAMYGEVKGMEIFEKYKEGKLKTDEGLLDLDLMVDLLYQLGSTQPIYQSAMPTAYLNKPGVRLMYCLYSFSIKQVDWVIQGTKEVYQNQLLMGNNKAGAATVAGLRCVRALTVVALISALVGDLISTAKGDEEDTVRWNWINNGWKEGLKRLGINGFTGFLKIFNISRYDSYIFKREGLLGVLMSKLTPASVSIANDLINIAVGKEELSDLGRYGPLFLKPMYYIFKNNDMMPDYKLWEGSTGGSKSSKFGKTSVGTSGPVNTSKFGGYSVK